MTNGVVLLKTPYTNQAFDALRSVASRTSHKLLFFGPDVDDWDLAVAQVTTLRNGMGFAKVCVVLDDAHHIPTTIMKRLLPTTKGKKHGVVVMITDLKPHAGLQKLANRVINHTVDHETNPAADTFAHNDMQLTRDLLHGRAPPTVWEAARVLPLLRANATNPLWFEGLSDLAATYGHADHLDILCTGAPPRPIGRLRMPPRRAAVVFRDTTYLGQRFSSDGSKLL